MDKRSKIVAAASAAAMTLTLSSCGRKGYEGFVIPQQGQSTLHPVSDIYRDTSSDSLDAVKEKTLRTVRSSDGICVIECKESYYDVTIDYEKATPYAAGAAYAEAASLAYENYAEFCEGYIFENIKGAFNDLNGNYSGIEKRTETIRASLDRNYREELEGFAEKISGDSTGIREDGILSREEAVLIQLVPDVLRGTACSAISASGSATSSGERLTCRVLEWQLGSENQLCSCHALIHMKNGDKSFVSLSYLGSLTILTAINDDGVMLGELDVGSKTMVEYSCENKTSYTYGMRYALENCTTAREAAAYLVSNASRYPYCANVLATDKTDGLVAELSVTEEDGTPLIRDSSTPLVKGLEWDDPEYICAVNSFAAMGNSDTITNSTGNIVRWKRFSDLFCGERELTLRRMKQLLTSEKTDNDLIRIRSDELVHMAVADYSTCTLQAILTGREEADDTPVFIDLGSWKQDNDT